MRKNATVLIRFDPRPEGGRAVVCHIDDQGRENEVISLPSGGGPDYKPPDLSGRVDYELDEGNKGFIVDLRQASWLSSTALGWLIGLWRRITTANGIPVLVCTSKRVASQLESTKLEKLIHVCDSVPDAQQYLEMTLAQDRT
ncbi:MAG: STAS domain-containing protein [Candidatus Latescibacterota bacterium]|nr:MAG: STAS domain-containing protein [Candidatus Latescibacterota bacterium]